MTRLLYINYWNSACEGEEEASLCTVSCWLLCMICCTFSVLHTKLWFLLPRSPESVHFLCCYYFRVSRVWKPLWGCCFSSSQPVFQDCKMRLLSSGKWNIYSHKMKVRFIFECYQGVWQPEAVGKQNSNIIVFILPLCWKPLFRIEWSKVKFF